MEELDTPNSKLRAAWRKVWFFSLHRKIALRRAKIMGTKSYRCEGCHLWTEKPEVDHIVPCGSTKGEDADWNGFKSRLFCQPSELQVLCHECHQAKTKAGRSGNAQAS